MRIITLLLVLFSFQIANAQIPDWEWVKNMDMTNNNWRRSITTDNNGDVIVITDFTKPTITFGNITINNDSPSYYYSDIAMVKYDSQGNVKWAKRFGGPKTDWSFAITTDNAGNIYFTGGYQETITIDSFTLTAFTLGYYIAKLDTNGNTVFVKKITNEEIIACNVLKTDNDGNVYLTGIFSIPTVTFDAIVIENEGFQNALSSDRSYVAKMDGNGNYLWVKASQSPHRHFTGVESIGLAVDDAGNVYNSGKFGCNTLKFGAITVTKSIGNDANYNMYLVKYDTNGNEMWVRSTGSTTGTQTCARAVKTDSDGNVYTAGFFSDSVNFGNTTLNSSGGEQQFIVKYNPNGDVIWIRNANAPAGHNAICSIDTDENNNLYTTGIFNNAQVDFGNGVVLTNPVEIDGALFVVKYTPEGEAVWGRKALSLNKFNFVNINCVTENDIYISSSYNGTGMTFGNHTIVKSEENYNQFLAKLAYNPLNTTDWDQNSTKVYPNPVKEQLTISNPEQFKTYRLYTMLGVKVKEGTIREEINTIDLSSLAKGIYLLELANPQSRSETIKIIKE
ncbi:T9SS type A sorting domain-containing protein [Flavobacterium cerinum]|uniref:T9SS type A sorting domain-containing protein n=1 Tax=Flavobacterium cerinum TaxID=2502784 RepID=A0ABY5IQU6_9FLAO|nr:T9SS type A sorting domain-containing protein [Flavobacterium cerinum]UUC45225.1 T9SS type A sorting domain-containing protein [Flavobacterium cerinum]